MCRLGNWLTFGEERRVLGCVTDTMLLAIRKPEGFSFYDHTVSSVVGTDCVFGFLNTINTIQLCSNFKWYPSSVDCRWHYTVHDGWLPINDLESVLGY